MSRAKLFIENFFAYGAIQILNKIIPFLLLPVITRLLPDTSHFGIYDMYNLIIGFGTPFVILGLQDAMFRQYFENENQQYKYDVTTTTQRMIFISSLLVCVLLLVLNKYFSSLFLGKDGYGIVVIYSSIGVFLGSNYSVIIAPTRIQNERKIFIISGLLSSSGQALISIVLLYMGFSYYGLIYASISTNIVLLILFWFRNKKFFILGTFNKNIAKELLEIGLPLLPTFLIYWVYNSMDKIMIGNMLGITEMGIYSIGSRVAQISQFIYLAFAGGFQYFKFKTMNDKDQVKMNSKLFEYLGVVSIFTFLGVYPLFKLIFNLLFIDSYILGYKVAPYLFMSPLLLMLFQIIGSQFIVIKKSYLSTISLGLGALSNILLNMYLIPLQGIEGAAIATFIGFLLSIVVVSILAFKMNLLVIEKRFLLFGGFTILYLITNRVIFCDYSAISILGSVIGALLGYKLYNSEIKKAMTTLIKNIL